MDKAAAPTESGAPSSVATALHLVRKGELARNAHLRWDDPDGIASATPEKRQALLNNPLARDDAEPVQIIGTRGNRVIGRLDLIAGDARTADDHAIPMLWTSCLLVQQEARRSLMGVSLVLKMQSLMPTLGACGVSIAALPVLEKLKWRDFPMQRNLVIRRSRSVIERYLGGAGGVLTKIATAAADTLLLLHRALCFLPSRWRTAGLHCRRLRDDELDQLDPLLNQPLTAPERVRFHRSSGWIRWVLREQFDNDPRNQRAAFGVFRRDGTLSAYFLTRSRFYESATHRGFRNLTLGSLADWSIFDAAAVSLLQIVLLATRELFRQRVDAVEACLPRHAPAPSLRPWGFLKVGALHLLVKTSPASPLAAPEYADPAAWRVRPADGDNAFE